MTQRIARLCWLLVLFASAALSAEEGRQVAITIDDLPRGGDRGPDDLSGIRAMTQDLMRPFREQHIPVIGFVNTGRSQLDSQRGEPVIREALASRGKKLEFYRHPYLHTGPTPQIKKGLQDFLDARGYRVAPVTLDNADYPPEWVTKAFENQR